MLDISIGVPGKRDVILAQGTMVQIHSDCLRVIGGMYQQFNQHNPVTGGMFKDILLMALNSPDCPIWRDGAVKGTGGVISIPVPDKKDGDGHG